MRLYEYNEILDKILGATDGDIDEETGLVLDYSLLDRLEMERNEKIENLLLYAAQLSTDAADLSEYAAKLTARAKAKKNKAESIKEWLTTELSRYGDKKFETQKIKAIVSVRKVVCAPDVKLLPPQYIRIKMEADKIAIGAALKAGEAVPGAELVDSRSLTIK